MAKLSHPLEPSSCMGLEVLAQMSVAMQICTIFLRVPHPIMQANVLRFLSM